MNEARFLEIIAGKDKSVEAAWMRFAFSGLASGYGLVTRLRNRMYDSQFKRVHRVGVPVISIGNLTTGGTGKTPMVARVVQLLAQQEHRVGIVSRGYRSLDDAGNDEKRVLELSCPQVPHGQNRDRVAAAQQLIAEHHVEVIVADDAFQHRRLGRDIDVVLIDASQPWGYGHLLPRGLLREACSGLSRASVVVVTRADTVSTSELAEIWRTVRQWKPDAPEINVAFRASGFRDLAGTSAATLSGKALGFCGIGNPESFRKTLTALPIELADFVSFPDHHHYSDGEIERLHQTASQCGADVLVTTVKDLVKLKADATTSHPIWAVDIEPEFLSGRAEFEAALRLP